MFLFPLNVIFVVTSCHYTRIFLDSITVVLISFYYGRAGAEYISTSTSTSTLVMGEYKYEYIGDW